ncbi:hypothetical protein NE664_12115 [Anaerotignum faecicola]|nr:hypothetical protein [Anaerotignum faecicola]
MKKFLAVLISAFMVFGTAATAMAGQGESEKSRILRYVDERPDEFGGCYYVGKELHIAPLEGNEEEAYSLIGGARTARIDAGFTVVIDEPAEYSYDELETAFEGLREYWDEFDLTETSFNVDTNSLYVASDKEWTEEREQAVKDAVGVQNIEFAIYYPEPWTEDDSYGEYKPVDYNIKDDFKIKKSVYYIKENIFYVESLEEWTEERKQKFREKLEYRDITSPEYVPYEEFDFDSLIIIYGLSPLREQMGLALDDEEADEDFFQNMELKPQKISVK